MTHVFPRVVLFYLKRNSSKIKEQMVTHLTETIFVGNTTVGSETNRSIIDHSKTPLIGCYYPRIKKYNPKSKDYSGYTIRNYVSFTVEDFYSSDVHKP